MHRTENGKLGSLPPFAVDEAKVCFGPKARMTVWHFRAGSELLSKLVFEFSGSSGDLIGFCGFYSVFEADAGDDFGQIIKAA